jgi:hypothetical protein
MTKWSAAEMSLLTELWKDNAPREKILGSFPTRSKTAIWTKASFMKLGLRADNYPQRIKTPELVERASQLRAAGVSYQDIASQVGMSCPSMVRTWIDSAYAERRRLAARLRRASIPRSPVSADRHSRSIERDAMALAKKIPPDTRDITATLCGDPLPGRRAIDFRHEMKPRRGEVRFQ